MDGWRDLTTLPLLFRSAADIARLVAEFQAALPGRAITFSHFDVGYQYVALHYPVEAATGWMAAAPDAFCAVSIEAYPDVLRVLAQRPHVMHGCMAFELWRLIASVPLPLRASVIFEPLLAPCLAVGAVLPECAVHWARRRLEAAFCWFAATGVWPPEHVETEQSRYVHPAWALPDVHRFTQVYGWTDPAVLVFFKQMPGSMAQAQLALEYNRASETPRPPWQHFDYFGVRADLTTDNGRLPPLIAAPFQYFATLGAAFTHAFWDLVGSAAPLLAYLHEVRWAGPDGTRETALLVLRDRDDAAAAAIYWYQYLDIPCFPWDRWVVAEGAAMRRYVRSESVLRMSRAVAPTVRRRAHCLWYHWLVRTDAPTMQIQAAEAIAGTLGLLPADAALRRVAFPAFAPLRGAALLEYVQQLPRPRLELLQAVYSKLMWVCACFQRLRPPTITWLSTVTAHFAVLHQPIAQRNKQLGALCTSPCFAVGVYTLLLLHRWQPHVVAAPTRAIQGKLFDACLRANRRDLYDRLFRSLDCNTPTLAVDRVGLVEFCALLFARVERFVIDMTALSAVTEGADGWDSAEAKFELAFFVEFVACLCPGPGVYYERMFATENQWELPQNIVMYPAPAEAGDAFPRGPGAVPDSADIANLDDTEEPSRVEAHVALFRMLEAIEFAAAFRPPVLAADRALPSPTAVRLEKPVWGSWSTRVFRCHTFFMEQLLARWWRAPDDIVEEHALRGQPISMPAQDYVPTPVPLAPEVVLRSTRLDKYTSAAPYAADIVWAQLLAPPKEPAATVVTAP